MPVDDNTFAARIPPIIANAVKVAISTTLSEYSLAQTANLINQYQYFGLYVQLLFPSLTNIKLLLKIMITV